MFIILIAHTPGNWATLWIPARFGFSDATEMFVFLSGMASAIAFGGVFAKRGWFLGTARVAFRIWQVYWAHIGLFLAVAATMAALNATELFERDYIGQLNLYPFFNGVVRDGEIVSSSANQLMGLLTLTYVPNYFDILPMYLVILAMMPFVIGLVSIHRYVAFGVLLLLWAAAQEGLQTVYLLQDPDTPGFWPLQLELPAEPWSEREWFFNPFAWQLIFFTGFAFMAGWLPKPPVTVWLIALAIAVVLLNIAFSNVGARAFSREWFGLGTEDGNPVTTWRRANRHWITKTDFGLFRYVHFLSLAYLFWIMAGEGGARLLALSRGIGAYVMPVILKVGQQSLAVFITSMFVARIMGWALDQIGRDLATMWLVNLSGAATLILVAYSVGWIKSQPWKKREAKHAQT